MAHPKTVFEGIVLAAGLSSRMKDWKPEIKIKDIPVIVRAVKPMIEHCEKVIVVGGFNFEKLHRMINEENYFTEQQLKKIVLAENKNYAMGMFASVKSGLQMIGNNAGVFIMPGDIPFVKSSTYSSLIKIYNTENNFDVFIPAAKVEPENSVANDMLRRGHPILIKSKLINEILSYPDDKNLRDVLEDFTRKFVQVNDKGIFIDIDDKNDLEKAKKIF